jgi:hypothetical protein
MNAAADAKIKMLEDSIQCLVCGILGLLPVIGFPFAVAALVLSAKVRARQKKNWNAAGAYRVWGVVCAATGTIFWGFILTIIIYRSANHY